MPGLVRGATTAVVADLEAPGLLTEQRVAARQAKILAR
jgi:hypothetical protein